VLCGKGDPIDDGIERLALQRLLNFLRVANIGVNDVCTGWDRLARCLPAIEQRHLISFLQRELRAMRADGSRAADEQYLHDFSLKLVFLRVLDCASLIDRRKCDLWGCNRATM
jgi:hypothetical protein